jgi:N-acetylglucosamine kinase-like BadF-type ATPase
MKRTDTDILVGIDAGGSKTHIRVEAAADGTILLDEIHASTGWANLGDAARAAALLDLVETATGALGSVSALVAGVHGNDSPEQEAILRSPLAARYPRVRVLNDSHLLILAHGRMSGTGVIAGTGSSATATVCEDVVTVGGWGWIFGDEGGAAGIVRDAAKQVLEAYDTVEDDPLAPRLLAHFGIDHPHGLTHVLSTVDPRIWSQAADVVFSAADSGSRRARNLIDAHALALAEMVALLGRRGGDVSTIVCAGGVITNQPSLFDAFTREVRRLLGIATETALLSEAPVTGALNLARQIHIKSQTGTSQSGLPEAGRIAIKQEEVQ